MCTHTHMNDIKNMEMTMQFRPKLKPMVRYEECTWLRARGQSTAHSGNEVGKKTKIIKKKVFRASRFRLIGQLGSCKDQ